MSIIRGVMPVDDGLDRGRVYATADGFKWEMKDFRAMTQGCPFLFLDSPIATTKFFNQSIQWGMFIYLVVTPDELNKSIQLILSTDAEIRAKITFSIFNKSKKMGIIKTMSEYHKFGRNGNYSCAFNANFILNRKHNILEDDRKLTIECKVEYEESEDRVYPCPRHNYDVLFIEGKYSDVSLVAEGRTVKAHKCILARKSEVFDAMFDAEMREKRENIVEIEDIKYDVLMEMLRFVYSDYVNDIQTMAAALAVAADKYALHDLRIECEKTMRNTLDPDNVIEYLQAADILRMDALKNAAIEFIVKKAIGVTKRPEFNSLPGDLVRMILILTRKGQVKCEY